MASVGRNDPCPCGSGRKYKHCCLQHADADRTRRVRLRDAEARVVPALLQFALANWGEDFLIDAWEEFVLWAEEAPDDLPDDPDFYPLFLPWFVFSYIADPHGDDPVPGAPDQPIGLAYLAEVDSVDDLERQLIESACAGGFSFFAVQSVTRGASIVLTDILTGHTLRALEESGSDTLHAGDILFAHPASVGESSILLGCSLLVIPPIWHNRIIDFREEMWPERRPTADDLRDCDFEIRDVYFDMADALVNPRPPQVANTDGEPLRPTTIEFELRCPVEEAVAALRSLSAAEDDEPVEIERDAHGTPASADVSWRKDDGTLLGRLLIEPGRMTAEVNSAERAARLRDEVAARLGDRAAYVRSDEMSMEELWERVRAGDTPAAAEAEVEAQDPALAAAEAELTARHWERWVDEVVPALGNQTPREAAKTPLGRERLEALFAEFAWRDERQPPHRRVDLAALRQRVGL